MLGCDVRPRVLTDTGRNLAPPEFTVSGYYQQLLSDSSEGEMAKMSNAPFLLCSFSLGLTGIYDYVLVSPDLT